MSSGKVSVPSFTIEAAAARNGDLIFQNLGNLRLRSALRAVKEVFDKQLDEEELEEGKTTRPAPAGLIDGIPELPGMQLEVNPSKLTWEVSDPLRGKERLLERVKTAISRVRGTRTKSPLRGVPTKKGKLDQHQMKTLCREILCFVESGDAKMIKGIKPTQEDIDEMPGRYLLNASNMGDWHQPKFEDQEEAWAERMNQVTGPS